MIHIKTRACNHHTSRTCHQTSGITLLAQGTTYFKSVHKVLNISQASCGCNAGCAKCSEDTLVHSYACRSRRHISVLSRTWIGNGQKMSLRLTPSHIQHESGLCIHLSAVHLHQRVSKFILAHQEPNAAFWLNAGPLVSPTTRHIFHSGLLLP